MGKRIFWLHEHCVSFVGRAVYCKYIEKSFFCVHTFLCVTRINTHTIKRKLYMNVYVCMCVCDVYKKDERAYVKIWKFHKLTK